MALSFKMVASEVLMSGLKKVPIAGTAVEVVEAIRARHEMAQHAERLGEVEAQLSRFETRQRDLVAEEIQSFLASLTRADLPGHLFDEEYRNFKQIQEQGWATNLFEGLLLNSTHRDLLKEKPQRYGRIVPDDEVIDTSREVIHLLADVDRPRLLELTPAAFSHVLLHQPQGVPEATLLKTEDVWAFPGASNPGTSLNPPGVNSVGMTMVKIEAGEFTMGSEENHDEKPPHRVRISRPFLLAAHQVTQGQYQEVTGQNPSHFKGADEFPVEQVSWFDAVNFCNALSEREGKKPCYRVEWQRVMIVPGTGYRLPTEAEWEYACRAGTTTRYPFGNDDSMLGEYAWYSSNSGGQTYPVGHLKANAWGLFDMLGNVWEWCWDGYDADYYKNSPGADPVGAAVASLRVRRGGGWGIVPGECRSAVRGTCEPSKWRRALGFRVAAVQAG